MVVGEASINNIMGGIESTGGVRLHNHRRKLKQRFDIIKKLGQGTYGKVQLGINKETGQEVAIKTIKKCKIETEADLVRIRREIQIMSSVQHPNIIHIYEVFENREKMVLVMEYAAGGELYDFLSERKVLAEDEARRIFRQIATAVYYCHKHKICHRDLKLENILLDEHGSAKIADFGLSNVFDEQRLLNTFCGSPLYASPEIVKGTPYHGPEVDCWSLGVLLYTLVYGAMPFDGSNFKRLVKQISQGDYFEPKKPSPASPLIREMLTVAPTRRADMEKICSHWWVNEGYEESCLDIAEDLANQTPVRLDLLLSLAPPPPQVGSDKLVIANEEAGGEECGGVEGIAPTRSHSVGSLMDVGSPAQRRLRDIAADSTFTETDENKNSPKRKLDVTASTENANQTGVKRKERSRKKDRESSTERRASHRSSSRTKDKTAPVQDESMTELLSPEVENNKSLNNESAANEASAEVEMNESPIEGAMCAELMEEANKKNSLKERRKSIKRKVKPDNKIPEEIEHEVAKTTESVDLQNKENHTDNVEKTAPKPEEVSNEKTLTKRKIIKKKIIKPKCEDEELKNEELKTLDDIVSKETVKSNDEKIEEKKSEITAVPEPQTEQKIESVADTEENKTEEVAVPPNKVMERRRSKIFETAEKFQNLLTSNESKTSIKDKPKKIIIPGVNVGGFKQAFERKASLTNSAPIPIKNSVAKKPIGVDSKQKSVEDKTETVEKTGVSTKLSGENECAVLDSPKTEVNSPKHETSVETVSAQAQNEGEDERQRKLKNAVNIISNAIDREGMRKSKSRPTMPRKPPVPFGVNGRSVSQQLPSPTDGKHLLKLQVGPEPTDIRTATAQVSTPEQTKYFVPPEETSQNANESDKKSVEVNLKSATLPRRKTSRAEITLNYPQPKPATMEFKTEMQHKIEGNPRLTTQRSEVSFPVSATPNLGFRSTSLEPEGKQKNKPRERIIPISFEREGEAAQSPPTKPPAPRPFQSQRSTTQSQRSASLSRQSTNDSDTDSAISGPEPIRKSPREYIIPIAVEGGGYVTPRAGSLEPSESSTASNSKRSISSRLRRPSRMSSLLSDRDGSEDESPFSTLHHGSIGRDSDNEDSRKDVFHLHRLRSSKPTRRPMEHADSLSSGEEDDDDGFEILTAENLFSTLLSRVRSLTQRLNVEDGGRPGFPSSRLLSHFGHDNFWNLHHKPDILSRHSPSGRAFSKERETNLKNSNSTMSGDSINGPAPWRRSVSRDLATDIEKVFGDSHTLPRGKDTKQDDIDLSDLNLANLNLSEKDTVALSFLTPGLSRRIQKQLLAQLPRSEMRKLSRTLSMRNSNEMKNSKSSIADTGSDQSRVSVSANDNDREKQSKYSTNMNRRSLSCEPDSVTSERLSALNNGSNSAGCNVSSETPVRPKLNYRPIGHDLNPYLFGKNIKDDGNWKSHTDILKKSPSYERSISDTLSSASYGSKSDGLNYLTGVSNSDLSEGDRKLLENYRKSRGSRRALRSMSLYERNPESFSKPPLPFKPSESSIFDDTTKRSAYTSPDQSVLEKYLSPVGSSYGYERGRFRSRSPSLQESLDSGSKTLDRKSSNTRRISRFLRPDFFDTPPDESIFAKEKKEKELETQKVLKEIRDKRFRQRYGIKKPETDILETDYLSNSILGSDSLSEVSELSIQKDKHEVSEPVPNINIEKMNADIPKAATEITPESSSDKKEEKPTETVDVKKTKSKISRLLRPKSYPDKSTLITKKVGAQDLPKNDEALKIINKNESDGTSLTKTSDATNKKSPDKETKLAKTVKVKSSTQKNKTENDGEKNVSDTSNGEKQSNKNKFLQSLEKKFEKLRTFSNSHNESSEGDSSLSRVGSAIRRLREQSLPRTTEPITESGLIKRAISVEDLPLAGAIGSDANKISRRSVTKILGLFKKYEDKDPTKNKSSGKNSSKTKKSESNEPSVTSDKKEKKVIKKSVKSAEGLRKNSIKSNESSEQNIKSGQESNTQETPAKISSAEPKTSSTIKNSTSTKVSEKVFKNSKNAAVKSSDSDDLKNFEKSSKVSDTKKIDTIKTSADASKKIDSNVDESLKKSKIPSKSLIKNEGSVERSQPEKTVRKIIKVQNNASAEITDNNLNNISTNRISNKEDASKVRPKSLFTERHSEPSTVEVNANSTMLTIDNEKTKTTSKLPVSANRRSLDLGNSMNNNSKVAENGENQSQKVVDSSEKSPNRRELKLDFTKLHKLGNATTPVETENNVTDSLKCDANKKSNDTNSIQDTANANVSSKDDSSMFLSPCDSEYSFDNWSVCSGDFGTPPDSHSHDFHYGTSINSGDENANESVSDRIRRKSFYSRFNEKKKPRKSSLVGPGASFNEFDLTRNSHRSYGNDKSPVSPKLSLDSLPTLKFRTLDLKSSNYSSKSVKDDLKYNDHKPSYNHSVSLTEPNKKYEKTYSRTGSLLKDPSYIKSYKPSIYHTYNPRLNRHIALYPNDTNESSSSGTSSGVGDGVNIPGISTRYNSQSPIEPSSVHLSDDKMAKTDCVEKYATEI